MKMSLFPAVIFAAMLPVTALASLATDQAFKDIHEPLAAEASTKDHAIEQPQILSSLGQSDGVAQTFYNIALETQHVTDLPVSDEKAPVASKPLDW
ncbi:hypothetical protein SAMN05661010_00853 [Modicisalibacter muralis]|uniref:Uncharacterized protein n=1 Tax=Modicisalibacter muralis TaxID=119000 RepID=A0A1G9GXB9_9GAMM|nr:hypothetical protein [Halomonas muralis]SDL05328.1 hypothetical protein SAMN05661010_00853 [Halomonas muralis]